MSVCHRMLETHQSSSRAEDWEPRWACHPDSKFKQMKTMEAVGGGREKCSFEHSLTFLGLISVPHQKKQTVGQTSRSKKKKMCSSLYLETELDDNDGDARTHILLCGHKFLQLISPPLAPPLAHPGRSASAEANFPSTQLWITAHLSWFTLARWAA